MKRWLAPIAIAAGLAAGAGPAVAAATPTTVDLTFTYPCPGFNATLHATGKGGTIELPGDRLTFTGPDLRLTVTGPTLKSVAYVITGATHVQILPDGSQYVTATGRNVILVPEANGHPAGLFLTVGTVSWTLNPDGSENTLFSGNGRVTDVCQLVAP
ncbi:hypothetical protein [Arthrobacter sp. efr-133-TYG-118]|uniref:hypothetical protein n=1 Tax=Arthrobacter sp. efr-133-TYG-118 TaxID=3040279 RepID=UPI00254E26BD|nr:hypothetical protein [Arthrobacter sp. efr-133-TYG-118]